MRGARCSNWAPGTLDVSNSQLEILINITTLGIELLLPSANGIGPSVFASGMPRFEPRVSHICLQQFGSFSPVLVLCPGDGDTAGNMTLVLTDHAPCLAQVGEWIGGRGDLGFLLVWH